MYVDHHQYHQDISTPFPPTYARLHPSTSSSAINQAASHIHLTQPNPTQFTTTPSKAPPYNHTHKNPLALLSYDKSANSHLPSPFIYQRPRLRNWLVDSAFTLTHLLTCLFTYLLTYCFVYGMGRLGAQSWAWASHRASVMVVAAGRLGCHNSDSSPT